MILRLVEACAQHRVTVVMITSAVALLSIFSIKQVRVDAIPDLSDPQVIVFTEWPGRSPEIVENQLTWTLVSRLVSVPHATDVRGYSMLGMSFVYAVFEEGTDLYQARSRVQESLAGLGSRLPSGVVPSLGPDATGVGWVFQYVLVDTLGTRSLAELRTFQDFTLRTALGSVPGVAEVASLGGYTEEFQVKVDPEKMRSQEVTFDEIRDTVAAASSEVGGQVLAMGEREVQVRGRALVASPQDLETVVVRGGTAGGAPVRLLDVASVSLGPGPRRGLLEWNGQGEAVGGIVVMRQGENAREVIQRVKDKLVELKPALPAGVEVEIGYDRSSLIDRAIHTLRRALLEEGVVVALVILLFLQHFRSALLPILTLPLAVGMAFIPMAWFSIPSTIMSLGGIAIAIGATVDAEIVMLEACHKKLEASPPDADRRRLLQEAAAEVTPAIFSSLLIIALSFLPIFALTGQAGRLFHPLAYTKTFVMLASALLSVTLAPALRDLLLRGRIRPESHHPLSRAIQSAYRPLVYVALRNPLTTVAIGVLAVASSLPLARDLGREFMPPLDEGDLLYMPTTLPGLTIDQARDQLQRQDSVLRSFPEVESVFGKIGRADSATDPAPLTMVETTVRLKPVDQWRTVQESRWYSSWAPAPLAFLLRPLWPDKGPLSWEELVEEMNRAMAFPGWTNAFTMPIKTRIDMLSTGIRTAVGVKVFSPRLADIEAVGPRLEALLRQVPGTRSVLYERSSGAMTLDITPRREALARYGLSVASLQVVVEGAIGGETVGETVRDRARLPITIRLSDDARSDPASLKALPVAILGMDGKKQWVPLEDLADVELHSGPPMLRGEDGLLTGYLYVDVDTEARDLVGYVEEAQSRVKEAEEAGTLNLPPGTFLQWAGQYQETLQMVEQMKAVVPLALALIALLLYLQFRSVVEVLVVLLSLPFALTGSVWLLWLLDYRLSTAVWVGIIALGGLAAQTGIVMVVYIDAAFHRRKKAGLIRSLEDIIHAHTEGTVLRVRPKLMTISTMLAGLIPLLWATGSGADVMKRIAAPMVGGLLTSAFLTLEIIPVIYTGWRYEELLWERVQATDPRRLARMRRLAWVVGGGSTLLGVAALLPIYGGSAGALPCLLAGGILLGGGGLGYWRERPGSLPEEDAQISPWG